MDPWVAYHGRQPLEGEPVWPARVEALLAAFAWEAAEREQDVMRFREAFEQAVPSEE